MPAVFQQAASAALTVEKNSNHKNVLFTGCPRNFVEPKKVFLVVSTELYTDREIGLALLQKRSKALVFSASAKVLSSFM